MAKQGSIFDIVDFQKMKKVYDAPDPILFCGDCLERMSEIPDKVANMIFADLPFGTTNCDWDIRIPFEPLWNHFLRITKENSAIILKGQQPFTTDLINSNRKMFRYEWIWEKTQKLGFLDANRKPLRAHENILVFYKKQPIYNPQKSTAETIRGRVRKTGVNRYEGYGAIKESSYIDDGTRFPQSVLKVSNWNGALFGKTENASKHPTETPVELIEYFIKTYTNEGDVVVDPTMGRGSSGVACKITNRHFYGIEKKKNFFDEAKDRIINF